MPLDLINVGLAPNDHLGDPLRTAFQKSNANDVYLDAKPPNPGSVTVVALADGALTADAIGRAKMQDGYLTDAKVSTDAALYNRIAHIIDPHDKQYAGGAPTDGIGDSTAALLAAAATGGTVKLLPIQYSVSMDALADMPTEFYGVKGATIFKKRGSAGISSRGIFTIESKPNAALRLTNIIFDLNGEGPQAEGVAGRIPNTYNTVTGRTGISGPANSGVYALRASNIFIDHCEFRNTGESGLLFRNCANVHVTNCLFQNIAGSGIEFSFPAVDGGSGPIPTLSGYWVRDCIFIDHDDKKLGAGNGIGVSFASSTALPISDAYINGCLFLRCSRDIHVELTATVLERYDFSGNTSYMARQGSIALVRSRDGTIMRNKIVNAGGGPWVGGNTNYPEIYGVALTNEFDNVIVAENSVIDRRALQVFRVTDAAMTAGDNLITSASATFTAPYIGTYINVDGAGPSGSPVIGLIASVVSPTSVRVNLTSGGACNAAATVSGASCAWGGNMRRPMIFNIGTGVDCINNRITGGSFNSLPGEPFSAAVYFSGLTGVGSYGGNIINAPPGSLASHPSAYRISTTFTGALLRRDPSYITGFDQNFDNFSVQNTAPRNLLRKVALQDVFPSATINTFGTDVVITPRGECFAFVVNGTVEGSSVVAETLTVEIQLTYNNGTTGTAVDLTFTANTKQNYTGEQLSTMHRNNEVIKEIRLRAKSSIGSSGAKGRVSLIIQED